MPLLVNANTSDKIVPRLKQRVFVNGQYVAGLSCTKITCNHGVKGCIAELSADYLLWNSVRKRFSAFDIEVYADYGANASFDANRCPVFRGVIDESVGVSKADASGVVIVASSWLGHLAKMHVGQALGVGERTYLRATQEQMLAQDIETVGAVRKAATIGDVLFDLFRYEAVPETIFSNISLGYYGAILGYSWESESPSLSFDGTFMDALKVILSLCRSVSVRERFVAGHTYIDLFEFGYYGHKLYDIGVAGYDSATGQVNVGGYNIIDGISEVRKDTEDTYSRAIIVGAPTERMITFEYRPLDSIPEYAFQEQFCPDEFMLTPDFFGVLVDESGNITEYTDEQKIQMMQDVVSNPEMTQVTSPLFSEAHRYIFRRYKLPETIRQYSDQYIVMGENAFTDSQGRHLQIQGFINKIEYTDVDPDINGGIFRTGEIQIDDWQLATCQVSGDYVIFEKPTVRPVRYEKLLSKRGDKVTSSVMNVGVTVTIAMRGDRVTVDTGVVGNSHASCISDQGDVYTSTNETARLATIGGTLPTSNAEFGALWFRYDCGQWQAQTRGIDPDGWIIQDDRKMLLDMAYAAISERASERVSIDGAVIPFISKVHIGQKVRVAGAGIDNDILTITSVVFSFGDGERKMPETIFSATSEVPARTDIKRKFRRSMSSVPTKALFGGAMFVRSGARRFGRALGGALKHAKGAIIAASRIASAYGLSSWARQTGTEWALPENQTALPWPHDMIGATDSSNSRFGYSASPVQHRGLPKRAYDSDSGELVDARWYKKPLPASCGWLRKVGDIADVVADRYNPYSIQERNLRRFSGALNDIYPGLGTKYFEYMDTEEQRFKRASPEGRARANAAAKAFYDKKRAGVLPFFSGSGPEGGYIRQGSSKPAMFDWDRAIKTGAERSGKRSRVRDERVKRSKDTLGLTALSKIGDKAADAFSSAIGITEAAVDLSDAMDYNAMRAVRQVQADARHIPDNLVGVPVPGYGGRRDGLEGAIGQYGARMVRSGAGRLSSGLRSAPDRLGKNAYEVMSYLGDIDRVSSDVSSSLERGVDRFVDTTSRFGERVYRELDDYSRGRHPNQVRIPAQLESALSEMGKRDLAERRRKRKLLEIQRRRQQQQDDTQTYYSGNDRVPPRANQQFRSKR